MGKGWRGRRRKGRGERGRRLEAADSEKKEREKERKSIRKGVWGAAVFPLTPDRGPLCHPSAGLSGGFVGGPLAECPPC